MAENSENWTVESKQSGKPASFQDITKSFDSCEKQHVLPASVLMQLKSLVKDKTDAISKEIISYGVGPVPPGTDDLELVKDINDDSWPDFKFPDLFECSDSETSERKPKHKHGKKETSKKELKQGKKKQKCQSQDLQKQPGDTHRKRGRASSGGDAVVKMKKERPNYFIAVQVTNPEIHSIAKKIQTGIQENSNVDLKRAFIGVEKFHLTLMVMHLPEAEEIKRAADSLDKCVPAINERTCGQPVTLDFEGLSTFGGGRVLFASLKPSDGLDQLHFMAGEVSKQMNLTGIYSTEGSAKKFSPHLTLMKFQGDKTLLKHGIKKVKDDQYLPFAKEMFGAQTVCSMQLCNMTRKREDGYYFVEHEVFFCK